MNAKFDRNRPLGSSALTKIDIQELNQLYHCHGEESYLQILSPSNKLLNLFLTQNDISDSDTLTILVIFRLVIFRINQF